GRAHGTSRSSTVRTWPRVVLLRGGKARPWARFASKGCCVTGGRHRPLRPAAVRLDPRPHVRHLQTGALPEHVRGELPALDRLPQRARAEAQVARRLADGGEAVSSQRPPAPAPAPPPSPPF